MAPIRFALITYGKVARLHARAIKNIPDALLVAVYGRDAAKREAFATEFGLSSYDDIALMVKERDRKSVV